MTNKQTLICAAICAGSLPAVASDSLIKFEPQFHLRMAHGNTSLADREIELGGHDPSQDGFTLQGVELATVFHIGESFSGMAVANIFKRNGQSWDSEFEEGYLSFHGLGESITLRGGRKLASFGVMNPIHSHGFSFVDSNAPIVRYLGEDGFALDGAELQWDLPTPWEDSLFIGFGQAVTHTHEEEDHGMMGGGMGGHAHDEEAEMARPEDDVLTLRYQVNLGCDDFHRFILGVSYLTGTNGFGMTTDIYGLDFSYLWRENGYEPGGKQLLWRTEWIMRDVENDEGGFDDQGLTTEILWQFAENWEAGLRYDWLEGVEDPELLERNRYSAALTRNFQINDQTSALVRLQWNHDEIKGEGSEDSVWIQFGFDWGPGTSSN